ncbi:hypothetical protein Tco_1234429 [Tanacetum coccineum]
MEPVGASFLDNIVDGTAALELSVAGVPMKEDVKMAVECLMDKADEEGKQRRKRASELAEMAKRAMAEGGSSYHNISSLIQDITQTLKHN